MPLGLFPRETQDVLAGGVLDAGTTPPVQPGFFEGTLSALGSGLAEGGAKAAMALLPADRSMAAGMPPIGAPAWAYENYEKAQHEAERLTDDEYHARVAADTTAALREFAPNPHTTGLAGQTLHGLASGLTRMLAGGVVAGPLGAAVGVGATEGIATQRELVAAGVDENTANALGAGTALFSGAGALLPGGIGSTLTQRVASGAAIQTEAGILSRATNQAILTEAGYPQQAAAYRPLDGVAVLSDAVLGMAFGGAHHFFFRPSDVDAAHQVADAHQVETAAPGPAADGASRTGIVTNVDRAGKALLNDQSPPEAVDVQYVPNPAQEAARETTAQDATDAAAEAGARPVAAPAEPEAISDAISRTVERVKAEGLNQPELPKTEGEAAGPVLDPATAEVVAQAQEALSRLEGVKIENDAGELVDAAPAMARAVADIGNAQAEGDWHRIAAACFGRG